METKAHTVKRFDAELEELNNNVVKMASAVEEQLGRLGGRSCHQFLGS